MTTDSAPAAKLRVLIAGGGVAAIETALALGELAGELTDVSLIAPGEEFLYRPMTVREPFALEQARRYPLARIAADAGATLIGDELAWVDADARAVHTGSGAELAYDALVVALGGKAVPRYEHALTIDDRHLDELLHGVIQDVESGYLESLAFVSPGRMPWQLPLYELALQTAARAYDMDVEVAITLVTPEDSPLAIFGAGASSGVAALLERSGIQVITSAYAEIPRTGELVINPGDRRLHVDRVIALPELYGPGVRGLPLHEHGFLRVDPHGKVLGVERVYAAGDTIEFAVKHGGLAAQQADAAAEAIAALAGAPVEPKPFHPIVHGMLLTGGKPLYLTAKIAGGHGFSSELTEEPTWSPPSKIAARYLAPYLDRLDREQSAA
jgi:sulfide:quinone oxidoreductase